MLARAGGSASSAAGRAGVQSDGSYVGRTRETSNPRAFTILTSSRDAVHVPTVMVRDVPIVGAGGLGKCL